MKAIKFFLVAMVAIIFASCAGINTSSVSNNVPETKLILKEANYQIVGEATGEWTATYVFGIGGLSKKALKTNALGEMYKNAQLTGTQQIINVTTTVSTKTILGIYTKQSVIAHGYVIEFVK